MLRPAEPADVDALVALARHPDVAGTLSTDAANGPMTHPTAHLHTQWPGAGDPDDPNVRAFAAGTGPMLADIALAHALEQACGAALVDEIGPAEARHPAEHSRLA